MANKKVNQLTSKPAVNLTDLFLIADPTSGQAYKTTISDLGTAIGSGVSSVNTLVGAVVLDTDDIQELVSPTNKWFTDTRARAAISAGTGISYNSGTGVITNAVTSGQIATALGYTPANGANYLPLTGGNLTGALGGTSATFSLAITIIATSPKIYLNSNNNSDYYIANDSGTFKIYDTSNFENRFTISPTGNGTFGGNLTVGQIIRSGGTSSQFLKADGSVDSSTYLTTSSAASTYVSGSGATGYYARFTDSKVISDGFIQTTSNITYVEGMGLSTLNGLDIEGNYGAGTGGLKIRSYDETTGNAYIDFANTGGRMYLGLNRSTAGGLMTNATAYATVLTTGLGTSNLEFGTNATKRLTIDGTTGAVTATSSVTASALYVTGMTAGSGAIYHTASRLTFANYNANGTLHFEVNGGTGALTINADTSATFNGQINSITGVFGTKGGGSYGVMISDNDQSNVRLRFTNTGSGGRSYSIVGGLPGANNSSFAIHDETANSTRFNISDTGAATFSSSVTTGGEVFLPDAQAIRSNGELMLRRSGNELRLGSGTEADYTVFFAGGSQKAIITSAGKMVIGGSVNGTALNDSLTVNTPSAGNYSGLIAMTADTQRGYYGGTSTGLEIGVAGSGYFSVWTSGSERMRIDSDGTITFKKGNQPVLNLKNTTASGVMRGAINWYGADSTNIGAQIYAEGESTGINSILAFYTKNSSTLTERMRITSGGQVQIKEAGGTHTSDGLSLINTNSNTWNLLNAADNFFYFGYNGTSKAMINPSNGSYGALSDKNKKESIELSNIGLSEIMQLKPSLYRFKDNKDNNSIKELGFIAQEVKDCIPNAYVESGEFIGLNYNPIVAALTKAVQELKAELDTLKNK